jgi:hypothetical protein
MGYGATPVTLATSAIIPSRNRSVTLHGVTGQRGRVPRRRTVHQTFAPYLLSQVITHSATTYLFVASNNHLIDSFRYMERLTKLNLRHIFCHK